MQILISLGVFVEIHVIANRKVKWRNSGDISIYDLSNLIFCIIPVIISVVLHHSSTG